MCTKKMIDNEAMAINQPAREKLKTKHAKVPIILSTIRALNSLENEFLLGDKKITVEKTNTNAMYTPKSFGPGKAPDIRSMPIIRKDVLTYWTYPSSSTKSIVPL
ncbi:hypothetical protein GCM10028819_25410 [Spirosoma humi]